METTVQTQPVSKAALWTGRVIEALNLARGTFHADGFDHERVGGYRQAGQHLRKFRAETLERHFIRCDIRQGR